MVGIAGILTPIHTFLTRNRLRQMLEEGVDPASIWIDDNNNTGFSHQQSYLHYTICFDGDIYNAPSLRMFLESKGYHFPDMSNAIIVMAAYDFWKEKCMEELRGAFAFALYNSKEQSLLLTRDRLGEKPLFYYGDFRERGRFVQLIFASNMQSLWNIGAPQVLDPTMVLNYLTLGYTTNPNKKMATFYSDILALPPGNFLKIFPKEGKTQMRNWYRPNIQKNEALTDEEAVNGFGSILSQSLSDCTNNLEESSLSFISNIINNSNSSSSIYENDALSMFDPFCKTMEEPVANISVIQQFAHASDIAQQNNEILLSEIGFNEIFGRKNNYQLAYLQYLIRNNYKLFQKEKKLFRQNGNLDNWKISHYWQAFSPKKTAQQKQNELIKQQNNFPFLNEDFLLRYQNIDMLRQPETHQPEDAMYFDIFTLGLEEQLKIANKTANFFSKKIRFPFIEYQLVEFMLGIPSRFKFRDGFSEWIVRKWMENKMSKNAWSMTNPPSKQEKLSIPNEQLMDAKSTLVAHKIFTKKLLEKNANPNQENVNWRFINMAYFLNNINF